MKKVRLGGVILLAAYLVSLVGFNWQRVEVRYLPFVSPSEFRLPVLLLGAFLMGAATSYLLTLVCGLKRRAASPEAPATLPPAHPAGSTDEKKG